MSKELYMNINNDVVKSVDEWVRSYTDEDLYERDLDSAWDAFREDVVDETLVVVVETATGYELADSILSDAWMRVDPSRRIGHDRVRDLVINELAELRGIDTTKLGATIKISEADADALGLQPGEYALRVVGCDGPAPVSDCERHDGEWYHENSSELADIVKSQQS